MGKLQQAISKQPSESGAIKRRAVGGGKADDEALRGPVTATAKTVVGLDSQSRRVQWTLESCIPVESNHPYVVTLLHVGKQFDADRRAAKESKGFDALAALVPAHERLWVQLLTLVKEDDSIQQADKHQVLKYYGEHSGVHGHIMTAMRKKCHRQCQWSDEKYRISLMAAPGCRHIQLELVKTIGSKPNTETAHGAPARGLNIKKVVSRLIEMGGYEAEKP